MKTKTHTIIVVGFLLLSLLSSIHSQSVNVATGMNFEHTNAIYTSEDLPIKEWSDTKVVSTESTGLSYNPSIAIDSNENVHAVWQDVTDYVGSGPDSDIFYKYWDYSSQNWSTTELLSTESTGASSNPSIVIDSADNLHVIWQDQSDGDWDLFYKCWNSTTENWETSVDLTQSGSDFYAPALAMDSQCNIHLTFEIRTAISRIYYGFLNITNKDFSHTIFVSSSSTENANAPSIALDGQGNAHIVWMDRTDLDGSGTDSDIFYAMVNTTDYSVSDTLVITSESTGYSRVPSIIVDSLSIAHIAWVDETDYGGSGTDRDIFYRTLDLESWGLTSIKVISTGTGDVGFYNPAIAIDAQRTIYVVWDDTTEIESCGTDSDIFYRSCSASTNNYWTQTSVLSTESTANSFNPVIALDNLSNIFVIWQDDTDYLSCGSDRDIFYIQLFGPPIPPDLASIEPNPSYDGEIHLDWNDMFTAYEYYVYRSSSYIWSVEDLEPISVVSDSNYSETLSIVGRYFYVVTANNYIRNSSRSNCQSVEIIFPEDSLPSPTLSFILPNPTDANSISLMWDEITGATKYYVYRSTSYIWSLESLDPIETVFGDDNYIDSLPSEGHYFYVIVASDGLRNSSISNCEYVYFELPHIDEFIVTTCFILSFIVINLIVSIFRKRKKQKLQ